VRLVATNASNVAALLAALGVDEVAGGEERCRGGRGAEDDVARADVLLEQALVFGVRGRENGLLRAGVVFGADGIDIVRVVGDRVVEAHEAVAGGVEGAGDDVEVVDLVATQEQGEADVPVGLLAGAEDRDVVDGLAFLEQHGRGECCAESGDFFGVDEAGGASKVIEKSEGTSDGALGFLGDFRVRT